MEAIAQFFSNFMTIITNKIFYITFSSWFAAQVIKFVLHFITHKKFNFRLLVGTGGMPSSHTAAVTAGTMCTGMATSWDSPILMVCLLFCIVVISDAVGVRRAAGKQAATLNKMLDDASHAQFRGERLKELLGHTPLEAAAGLLLGILIPILMF